VRSIRGRRRFEAAPAGLNQIQAPMRRGIENLLEQFEPLRLMRLAPACRENIG
jgi:hypothetical protein